MFRRANIRCCCGPAFSRPNARCGKMKWPSGRRRSSGAWSSWAESCEPRHSDLPETCHPERRLTFRLRNRRRIRRTLASSLLSRGHRFDVEQQMCRAYRETLDLAASPCEVAFAQDDNLPCKLFVCGFASLCYWFSSPRPVGLRLPLLGPPRKPSPLSTETFFLCSKTTARVATVRARSPPYLSSPVIRRDRGHRPSRKQFKAE